MHLDLMAISPTEALTSSNLFMAGSAIIGVMVVMRWTRRRAIRSRSGKQPSVRQRYAQLAQDQRAARSLEKVMAEMDELSRQIHGRLDTKIARLEAIIRDADERIANLSPLIGSGAKVASAASPAVSSLDVTLESEEPLEFHSPEMNAGPRDGGRSGDAGRGNIAPLDDAHARIYALADRGRNAEQIASDVSRPVGEVQLILSLRETSGSSLT